MRTILALDWWYKVRGVHYTIYKCKFYSTNLPTGTYRYYINKPRIHWRVSSNTEKTWHLTNYAATVLLRWNITACTSNIRQRQKVPCILYTCTSILPLNMCPKSSCALCTSAHYNYCLRAVEAAHHKFQRRLLGIKWRDKVRNEDIRKKTGSRKLEDIIKERRLRWLGHVLRMDNSRTARQATHWELRGYKRKPGRPKKNWVDVIKRDLRQMDLTWEEAEELANDKAEWRRRVAQCSHLDAVWTKV